MPVTNPQTTHIYSSKTTDEELFCRDPMSQSSFFQKGRFATRRVKTGSVAKQNVALVCSSPKAMQQKQTMIDER